MEINIDSNFITTMINLGSGAIIIFLILFLIYHWDKVERFFSSIAKLLTSIKKSGSSEVFRLSIQSDINQTISELDNEVPGLFDKRVKVRWLELGEEHANLNQKGIFIRVSEIEDSDKLLVKSINFLIEKALLLPSRPYIHGHIFAGIKLVLAEKFLTNSNFRSAMVSFRKDIYNPTISNDRSIASATNQLENLDYQGLFTRIFLR
jgi:hypothetical protein